MAQNAKDVVNIYTGQPPVHGIDSCRIVLREAFNSFKYKPGNQLALADNNYVFVFLYADAQMIKSYETDHAKMVEIFKFNDEGKIVLHTAVGENSSTGDIKYRFDFLRFLSTSLMLTTNYFSQSPWF